MVGVDVKEFKEQCDSRMIHRIFDGPVASDDNSKTDELNCWAEAEIEDPAPSCGPVSSLNCCSDR